MITVEFTPKDIPALRRAAKFLRRTELNLPATADSKTHDAILISALRLDDQADELGGQAPDPTVNGTRRPIFNQLVAPEAGGPMFHEEANALLDAHEDAVRAAAAVGALRLQGAMLALHPKTANPRHGCCATPKVCKETHRPECRSSEHTIGGQVPWPCKSLRAVGIRTDADADADARPWPSWSGMPGATATRAGRRRTAATPYTPPGRWTAASATPARAARTSRRTRRAASRPPAPTCRARPA